MLRERLKAYSLKEKLIGVLMGILILFSLRLCVRVSSNIPLFFEVPHNRQWVALAMIDKATGLKENLVEIAKWCRDNIPSNNDIFFFAPPEFFNRYSFDRAHKILYFPHRLRYYLYPFVRVWWFKPEYQFLMNHWSHIDSASKENVLAGINYIAGFSLDEKMFPSFKIVALKGNFCVLKKIH